MLNVKRFHGNSSLALTTIAIIGLILSPAPLSGVNAAAGDLDPKFGNGGTACAYARSATC